MQLLKNLHPALKKLISIAFFAGLVFLGARTCSVETASTELVFRLGESVGAPGEKPRELEVRLYEEEGTELVGSFRKYYQEQQGPDARWPLSVSAGTYRLEGELQTNHRVRSFTREVSLKNDEVVTITLDRHFKDEPENQPSAAQDDQNLHLRGARHEVVEPGEVDAISDLE